MKKNLILIFRDNTREIDVPKLSPFYSYSQNFPKVNF